MSLWDILGYVAWGISAILLAWMLVDALLVSSQYDEEYLMSSREGGESPAVHGVCYACSPVDCVLHHSRPTDPAVTLLRLPPTQNDSPNHVLPGRRRAQVKQLQCGA